MRPGLSRCSGRCSRGGITDESHHLGSEGSRSFIGEGRTGAATIQGSSPCVVKHDGGEITLKGDEKIEIKDGVIKIVS